MYKAFGLVAVFVFLCGTTFLPLSEADARIHYTKRYSKNPSRNHAIHANRSSGLQEDVARLSLQSSSALVVDDVSGDFLYTKNIDSVMPIASITKLMTAMVVLDMAQPLDEFITIDEADVDTFRNTRSRLSLGTTLPRFEMLRLALMSSENRAAAALARTYPGGTQEFVAAMNRKAKQLGMDSAQFVDATGLHSENAATARDLVRMVRAGYDYKLIREFTTTSHYDVELYDSGRILGFKNSNSLVASPNWDIGLSKTGFTKDAGRCLVMRAKIAAKPVIIVLLDSIGKMTRVGDANRIKKWMERRQA